MHVPIATFILVSLTRPYFGFEPKTFFMVFGTNGIDLLIALSFIYYCCKSSTLVLFNRVALISLCQLSLAGLIILTSLSALISCSYTACTIPKTNFSNLLSLVILLLGASICINTKVRTLEYSEYLKKFDRSLNIVLYIFVFINILDVLSADGLVRLIWAYDVSKFNVNAGTVRLVGQFLNPTWAASILIFIFLFKSYFYDLKLRSIVFYSLLVLITGARGPLLAALLTYFMSRVLHLRFLNLIIYGSVFCIVIYFFAQYSVHLGDLVNAIIYLDYSKIHSLDDRFGIWSNFLSVLSDRWFYFGGANLEGFAKLDNLFLFVLSAYGSLGVCLLLLFLGSFFVFCARLSKTEECVFSKIMVFYLPFLAILGFSAEIFFTSYTIISLLISLFVIINFEYPIYLSKKTSS